MKKKLYIFISIALFIFLLNSCNSGNKVATNTQKQAPEWVMSKPQFSAYYVGIGMVNKKGKSPENYTQAAKQNALVDLSSDISIKIESKSVLSILEANNDISDSFEKDIKTEVAKHLEGYEMVDTWEDKTSYWTYYRLSKDKYRSIAAERKQKVVLDAMNKYFNAEDLYNKKFYFNAFKLYTESLISLKPYLRESVTVDIAGKEEDLPSLVFKSIVNLINNVKIRENDQVINAKRWMKLDPDLLSFTIVDDTNTPMANLPIKVNFTGSGLLRNSETSDNDGKVYCSINKIQSAPNYEVLSVGLDVFAMTRQVNDNVIRSIIRKIPPVESKIRVIVEKPSLSIVSGGRSNGYNNAEKTLKDAFEDMLNNDFIIISPDKAKTADFVLSVSFDMKESGMQYGEYQVMSSYTFEMKDKNSNSVYKKSRELKFTSQSSYEDASYTACSETAKTIKRLIATEIISNINS